MVQSPGFARVTSTARRRSDREPL